MRAIILLMIMNLFLDAKYYTVSQGDKYIHAKKVHNPVMNKCLIIYSKDILGGDGFSSEEVKDLESISFCGNFILVRHSSNYKR